MAASQFSRYSKKRFEGKKYCWMQDEDFAYGRRLMEGVRCEAGPLENEQTLTVDDCEHGYDGKQKENVEPDASRFAVPVTEKDILEKIQFNY